MVLEKNPNYYNAANVSLDKLTFRLVPDPATSLAAYEAGDVDGIEAVPGPGNTAPRLRRRQRLHGRASAWPTYAFFNPAMAPVDNVKVRKALAEAVDRQNLIDFVMQSADLPATGLVPPGMNVAGEDFRDGTSDFGLTPTAQIRRRQETACRGRLSGWQGFP